MARTKALLPIATQAQCRRVLARLVAPRRGRAMVALLAVCAGTAVALAVPPILGAITQTVVDGGDASRIHLLATALLLVVATAAGLSALAQFTVAQVGELMLADLREQVLNAALELPLDEVEQAGSGDLATRVGQDADTVSSAVRSTVPDVASALLTIGLTGLALLALDWRLALAGLAAVPIQLLATRWYLARSAPLYAAERRANSERGQQITETVAAADTVRAFGLQLQRLAAAAQASLVALGRSLRASRAGVRFFAALNMAELAGLGAILVAGYFAVDSGAISIGAATTAALYFHGLFNPIGALLTQLDTTQDAGASLARLVGILPDPREPAPHRPDDPGDGVRVERVSFGYDADHPVLHEVSLQVEPGRRVVLVGGSGAGKTTLAKLVAGIMRPGSGTIRVGSRPDRALPPEPAHWVASVSQEVHLFAGTIADNLRLGRPDADDELLAEALHAVGAADWVDALAEGFDTPVGDGGQQLTVARTQHLALARLWLARAPVVILDEATAEAGSAAARDLERAAVAAIRGRTALVVAHRLTQAEHADAVAVLQDGRLVEFGPHAEVARAGGAYTEIWTAWATSQVAHSR